MLTYFLARGPDKTSQPISRVQAAYWLGRAKKPFANLDVCGKYLINDFPPWEPRRLTLIISEVKHDSE